MKHILIVDDDIHINKMLDEVLVHERYMVSHAYSGTEAQSRTWNYRFDF